MTSLLAVALLALFQPSPVVADDHPLVVRFTFFEYIVGLEGSPAEHRKAAEEFLPLCDERLKSHPKDGQTYVYRARAYEKLLEHGAPTPDEAVKFKKVALDSLTTAMSLGFGDHVRYAWRAKLRCLGSCEGKELDAAVEDMQKAVTLHPARAEYKKSLSDLLSRQGRGAQADALAKAAVGPVPKDDLLSWVEEMADQISATYLTAGLRMRVDRPAGIKEYEKSVQICSDVLERVDSRFLKVSWFTSRADHRKALAEGYSLIGDSAKANETLSLAVRDMDSAIEFAEKGTRLEPGWAKRCAGFSNCSMEALLSRRAFIRCESATACSPEHLAASVLDLKAAVRLDPAFLPNLGKLERPGGDIEAWKPVAASSRVAQGIVSNFFSTNAAALRGMRKALGEANVFNSDAGKPILAQRIVLTPVAPLDTYKFVELRPDLTVAQASEKVLADIKADDRIMSKLAELGAR